MTETRSSTTNPTITNPTIEVRRSDSRFHTRAGWLDGRHSFSFGSHYDPDDTHHGLLLVLNEDHVAPGQGFGTHPHDNMEIVTWVLDGVVEHRDSMGNHGEIRPGEIQRMSAGTGVRHSEFNPDPDAPTHLLQMWVLPDTRGIEPSYEQRDVSDLLGRGGLVAVASGQGHEGAVELHQRDAVLWIGRLTPGETVTVPDAPHVHVFVARGDVELEQAGRLDQGDAARLTGAGPLSSTAGAEGAELVVWATA